MTSSVRRIAEQTVALLGADLAIHDEIGSSIKMPQKDKSRLDAQLFELFADKSILENVENTFPTGYNQDGRLKSVIGRTAWDAVRPQIEREVERAWRELQEKEKRRRENKQALSGDANWFSGIRRRGHTQKSAFRGLT